MRDVRRTLRALAEREPSSLPHLSVYLDMRPHATGERAAVRVGEVVEGHDGLRRLGGVGAHLRYRHD